MAAPNPGWRAAPSWERAVMLYVVTPQVGLALYLTVPIGSLERLPADQAAVLREVGAATQHHRGIVLNVAVAYSRRDDILTAVHHLLQEHHDCSPAPDDGMLAVTEQQLAQYLSTARQPDVDLPIRTSGEQHLSGFMPWQDDRAELYFTETLWPRRFSCRREDGCGLGYPRTGTLRVGWDHATRATIRNLPANLR
ncbi:MAG: undecaprenyl diphosphate synthase family protein [Streptomycetaceae bacterium]|nr:undecaprenyl diphosphate synthase family protein [Streptomycetaceae bacterium]